MGGGPACGYPPNTCTQTRAHTHACAQSSPRHTQAKSALASDLPRARVSWPHILVFMIVDTTPTNPDSVPSAEQHRLTLPLLLRDLRVERAFSALAGCPPPLSHKNTRTLRLQNLPISSQLRKYMVVLMYSKGAKSLSSMSGAPTTYVQRLDLHSRGDRTPMNPHTHPRHSYGESTIQVCMRLPRSFLAHKGDVPSHPRTPIESAHTCVYASP